jgi:hypothetical protein
VLNHHLLLLSNAEFLVQLVLEYYTPGHYWCGSIAAKSRQLGTPHWYGSGARVLVYYWNRMQPTVHEHENWVLLIQKQWHAADGAGPMCWGLVLERTGGWYWRAQGAGTGAHSRG